MDLLDRYLSAIRWNLPRTARADDIIAELRDVIASRIEEREEALGRPLDKDETSALLRDFGHPLIVAARYGTQQWLIGPDLFPFYWFSLKVVLALCVLIMIVSNAAGAIMGQEPLMRALAHGFGGAWWSLLGNAGLVTLIFAIIERTGWLSGYLNSWSPEQLPDLGELKVKPKGAWELVFEVAMGIAFLLWWGGVIHVPLLYSNVKGVSIAPAPVWTLYYWPIFALLAARLGLNVIQLLRPRWRAAHAAIAVGLAAAGVALLSLIYRAGEWVIVTAPGMAPDQLRDLRESLHLSLRITIVVIGVVWVFQAAAALWRLFTARRG
jgi:hypothetical protein